MSRSKIQSKAASAGFFVGLTGTIAALSFWTDLDLIPRWAIGFAIGGVVAGIAYLVASKITGSSGPDGKVE